MQSNYRSVGGFPQNLGQLLFVVPSEQRLQDERQSKKTRLEGYFCYIVKTEEENQSSMHQFPYRMQVKEMLNKKLRFAIVITIRKLNIKNELYEN